MPRAEEIVRALKGQWRGNGGVCRCPAHDDRNPSLCVTEQDGRVLAHCHARCRQEAVLGALARAGFDIQKSSSGGADVHNYRHPELDKPSRTWPYHDAKGKIAAFIARFETQSGKEFRPLVFKDGRWRAAGLPPPRPLFNLLGILDRSDAPVLVCEGEKAAEAAARRFPDAVATTLMHGARSPHKTDWSPVKDKAVTVWPDNDEAGASFAEKVARLAEQAGAASVRTVRLPEGLPKGWDLADEPPAGLDFATLLDEGQPCETSEDAKCGDDEFERAVTYLAALSTHEYDRLRKQEAKRLNVRMGTLDDAVNTARPGTAGGQVRRVATCKANRSYGPSPNRGRTQ